MPLLAKLNVKPDMSFAVLARPSGVPLEGVAEPTTADAVLTFVESAADLEGSQAQLAIAAARRDAIAWLAYPKAGQLGTDLNRDSLARLVSQAGLRPVRQVSIDEVWSALRFRPA